MWVAQVLETLILRLSTAVEVSVSDGADTVDSLQRLSGSSLKLVLSGFSENTESLRLSVTDQELAGELVLNTRAVELNINGDGAVNVLDATLLYRGCH